MFPAAQFVIFFPRFACPTVDAVFRQPPKVNYQNRNHCDKKRNVKPKSAEDDFENVEEIDEFASEEEIFKLDDSLEVEDETDDL